MKYLAVCTCISRRKLTRTKVSIVSKTCVSFRLLDRHNFRISVSLIGDHFIRSSSATLMMTPAPSSSLVFSFEPRIRNKLPDLQPRSIHVSLKPRYSPCGISGTLWYTTEVDILYHQLLFDLKTDSFDFYWVVWRTSTSTHAEDSIVYTREPITLQLEGFSDIIPQNSKETVCLETDIFVTFFRSY